MTEPAHAEGTMRRAVALSLLLHGCFLLAGQAFTLWFPPRVAAPVMFVELTDSPTSPPPAPEPARVRWTPSPASASRPGPERNGGERRGQAPERWLGRLDAGLAKLDDVRPAERSRRTAGIAARRWETSRDPRPGDFPAAAPAETIASDGRYRSELERRVRLHGRGGAGAGGGLEAVAMFGGAGSPDGASLPAWLREMIHRKVRGYLPELEATYSRAMRRDPNLKGRLLVRFRIDPSGVVLHAELADRSAGDSAFGTAILERIRNWTFEPTGGLTVDVLYPFVFVSTS